MLILLALASVSCAAGSTQRESFREWNEEVKLNDGRVILVKQKWRCDRIGKYNTGKEYCSTMRESWLTINLPEFSYKTIDWHEQLRPMILNIDKNQLYIVGIPAIGAQIALYGNPQPPYIGYRWNISGWQQIPFNEIPETIYKTNLATEFPPGESPELFKVDAKDKSNNDPTLFNAYKKIDRNLRFNN